MQAKTHDSDPIPTVVFKEISLLLIQQISDIINILLIEGMFTTSWNVATINSLLKELRLDMIVMNYQPESNFTFMSKLIER